MRPSILLLAALLAGPAGAQTFDHAAFDGLLHRHVMRGLVDYDAFAAAPEFRSYLEALGRAPVEQLPPPERLALWLNAYNAYTIQLIVAHGERESIRNINRTLGLKLKGPWQEPLARVGGKAYDLDTIEHQIVRKQFHEPRIHFALVCAALSCPPLRSEAYRAERLDAQLEDQARVFLRESPDRNRIDVPARLALLSPIFDWYRSDFAGSEAELLRALARHFPDGPEKQLLLSGQARVRWTEYDWTLNSQEKGRARR